MQHLFPFAGAMSGDETLPGRPGLVMPEPKVQYTWRDHAYTSDLPCEEEDSCVNSDLQLWLRMARQYLVALRKRVGSEPDRRKVWNRLADSVERSANSECSWLAHNNIKMEMQLECTSYVGSMVSACQQSIVYAKEWGDPIRRDEINEDWGGWINDKRPNNETLVQVGTWGKGGQDKSIFDSIWDTATGGTGTGGIVGAMGMMGKMIPILMLLMVAGQVTSIASNLRGRK